MKAGPQRDTAWLQILGVFCLASSPAWLYGLFFADPSQPPQMEFVVVPALFLFALGLALHAAADDRFLRQVMCIGVILKLMASSATLYMAFHVYNSAADSIHYGTMGRYIADTFERTGELLVFQPFWSNAFIYNITGYVFIVFGASMVSGTVFFALLSFGGQYLIYRAFRIACPEGDDRMAAKLIFLLPSTLFWSATIGKDALALFAIGWAVYGFAQLDRRVSVKGFLALLFGLIGMLLVRPHVAGMLAMAFVVPYAFARNRKGTRDLALRLVSVPVLIVMTVYFTIGAQDFVGMDDISQTSSVLHQVESKSNMGGSAFGERASASTRAFAAPLLFFRPFPWEVHNAQSAIASAEAMLLLFITWKNRNNILAALRRFRQSSFTGFLILFLLQFSIIFSAAIANFGLLARERTMAIPLFAMLLCMAPQRRAVDKSPGRAQLSFEPEPREVVVREEGVAVGG